MKLNCKRIDFTYTPGEEIFTFPDESGLPFLFDVEKELTADPTGTAQRVCTSRSRINRRKLICLRPNG